MKAIMSHHLVSKSELSRAFTIPCCWRKGIKVDDSSAQSNTAKSQFLAALGKQSISEWEHNLTKIAM